VDVLENIQILALRNLMSHRAKLRTMTLKLLGEYLCNICMTSTEEEVAATWIGSSPSEVGEFTKSWFASKSIDRNSKT
jgi:hypothetical protein